MSTSIVKLYKNCAINRTKNMVVEDISTYLSSLQMTKLEEVQYIKNEYQISIKLRLDQTFSQPLSIVSKPPKVVSPWNYIEIISDDKSYYYFIDKATWRAESTVQFQLTMDVLNTFQLIENKNCTLSNKTHVTREHKDRYYQATKAKRIDYFSEDLKPTLYRYEDSDEILEDADLEDGIKTYLIYRNANVISPDNYENPVHCFVCFDREVKFKSNAINNAIIPSMLDDDKVYCATYYVSDGSTYHFTLKDSNGALWTTEGYNIYFFKRDNKIAYYVLGRITTASFTLKEPSIETDYFQVVEVIKDSAVIDIPESLIFSVRQIGLTAQWGSWSTTTFSFTSAKTYLTCQAFKYLDRTDSKLIKVIELPYKIFDLTTNEDGDYILPNGFTYSSIIVYENEGESSQTQSSFFRCLKLKDLNTKLQSNIETKTNNYIVTDLYNMTQVSFMTETGYTSFIRHDKTFNGFEPKLYHSDYYMYKFVYDSFSYSIAYEHLDTNWLMSRYHPIIKFNFLATSTINSKFIFDVFCEERNENDELVANFIPNRITTDFDGYIPIARNNEMPLFNVAYVNYIRTGYNYDVKKQTQDIAVNWAGVGLSALGFALSATIGGPIGIASAIGSAVGMAVSLTNAIKNTIQSEQSLEQKQRELKSQSASVSGSDDVDLMNFYSDNKLHLIQYQCSNQIKQLLTKLFYYTGYKSNRFGNDLQIQTRYWFNYLEAELVFDKINENIPEEIVNAYIEYFKNGVTIFHKSYDTTGTYVVGSCSWDFSQELENAETFNYE